MHRGQLPKHVRKTGQANTMADRPPRGLLGALPAHGPLTPGAHKLAIPLAGHGPTRLMDQLLGRGDEHAGVMDQEVTALGLNASARKRSWGVHAVIPSE